MQLIWGNGNINEQWSWMWWLQKFLVMNMWLQKLSHEWVWSQKNGLQTDVVMPNFLIKLLGISWLHELDGGIYPG